MKKFLDILLIVLLTLLVINLFSDKEETKVLDTILFEFADNNYTIPASIGVNVKNNTASGITFNTCSDINIKHSGESLSFHD
ncbi:hypothetical protein ACFLY2_00895 [Patescibacteria group bacterium]